MAQSAFTFPLPGSREAQIVVGKVAFRIFLFYTKQQYEHTEDLKYGNNQGHFIIL